MYASASDPVTSTQIIVAAFSIVASVLTVGGVIVAVTRSIVSGATEVRGEIKGLTQSLNNLSEAVKGGFDKVHERLDEGEKRMATHHTRLVKVEIHNGLEVGGE